MLVLLRYAGQSIHIGDDITVTILGERHGGIRVGIDAPSKVKIMREELKKHVSELNQPKKAN